MIIIWLGSLAVNNLLDKVKYVDKATKNVVDNSVVGFVLYEKKPAVLWKIRASNITFITQVIEHISSGLPHQV